MTKTENTTATGAVLRVFGVRAATTLPLGYRFVPGVRVLAAR